MINFIHYKHFIIINVRLEGEPENNVHGAAAAVCRECRTGVHTAQAHISIASRHWATPNIDRLKEMGWMDGYSCLFVIRENKIEKYN